MLPILYYNQLDSKSVQKNFDKVLEQLSKGDFKSADVRKMTNNGYYRARLNIKDRLLFTLASYNEKKYLVLLEVIQHHDYAKSRFLRGALLPGEDDMLSITNVSDLKNADIKRLNYVNESGKSIHVLNKFISFDDEQQAVFGFHPPLIIIGSAGSGKTVLVLEKLKQLTGNIAYISLSNYLFNKYLQWMKENNYYDSNMLSFDYLQLIKPRYDYIMIDEVQDITGIQLKCIMQSLNNKGHFILTGDSNQIVHPNFFSWSKIKTYLYQHGTDNKEVRILQTNYRNSPQVV